MRIEQGDGWTLYLGDCLEALAAFETQSVDAVVTDPPYGVSYQSARRTDKTQRKPKIANDEQPFIWWLHSTYRVTHDGGALLCFCRWDTQEAFRLAIGWAGFKVRQHVVWDRDWHGMADVRTMFAPQHDILWQASKGRCELRGIRPKSVIRSRRIAAERLVHPNEKPVDLMVTLVCAVTDEDALVLDPFTGSGTTGVACLQTGRRFIGVEIDAGYFDVACKRLEQAAAQKRLAIEAAG